MVRPAIVRSSRHNGFGRLIANRRRALAKDGHTIIHAVFAVHVVNVRCPNTFGCRCILVGPLRDFTHRRFVILPIVGVFRCPQLQIVVRTHEGVTVLEAYHARVMTRLQVVLGVPIGSRYCGDAKSHKSRKIRESRAFHESH